jgi:putative intracellular protease/amidase
MPEKERKVIVFVAEGTEEIEAVVAIDILRRGKLYVDVVSVENTLDVICSRGVHIIADKLFSEMREFDSYSALVIPGGQKGAATLASNEQIHRLLHDFENKGKLVCLICAGRKDEKDLYCFLNLYKYVILSSF